MKKYNLLIVLLVFSFVGIAQTNEIHLTAPEKVNLSTKTIRNEMLTDGKFLIVNTAAENSLKFQMLEDGETSWFLDGANFIMRDSDFEAYPGFFTTYDFISIDGATGRIGFNVLTGNDQDGNPYQTLDSSVNLFGSIASRVRRFDIVGESSYDVQQDDHTIILNFNVAGPGGSGPDDKRATLLLPSAATSKGRQYRIKQNSQIDKSEVIIDPYMDELIDEDDKFTIKEEFGVVEIVSDGTQWWIISANRKIEAYQDVTASISLEDSKNVIGVNFTIDGQEIVVDLGPAANYKGETFKIKRNADGNIQTSNLVKLTPASGEYLDNILAPATYDMDADFESVTIYSNGTRWLIVNAYNN